MQITCWTYKTDHNKVKKVFNTVAVLAILTMAFFKLLENTHFFEVKTL